MEFRSSCSLNVLVAAGILLVSVLAGVTQRLLLGLRCYFLPSGSATWILVVHGYKIWPIEVIDQRFGDGWDKICVVHQLKPGFKVQICTVDGFILLGLCELPACLLPFHMRELFCSLGIYIFRLFSFAWGPRIMQCVMDAIPDAVIERGDVAPTQTDFPLSNIDASPSLPIFRSKSTSMENFLCGPSSDQKDERALVLKTRLLGGTSNSNFGV